MSKAYRSVSLVTSILALSVITGAATSEAATKNTKNAMVASAVQDNEKVPFLDEAEYEKLTAEAKAGANRSIASPAQVDRFDYATTVADDLKNLIADLQGGTYWKDGKEMAKATAPKLPLAKQPVPNVFMPFGKQWVPADPNSPAGVKNSADLAALIAKTEANYENLSPSAKLVASQLIALKPFRGILYRLRPVAEAQHTKAIHGAIISYLRSLNAGVNNLFPSDQWKAGFDYIARPYAGMEVQFSGKKKPSATIENEYELNQYIANHVLTSQVELSKRVAKIDLNKPVYFDNKIFWNSTGFATDQDRYPLIGKAEKYAYMAAICGNISAINASLGYDWSDLFKATESFAVVYGFNSIARPDNMTAKKRTEEIKSNTALFTLLKGGEARTKNAYAWFKTSLKWAKLSWNELKAAGKAKTDSKSIALMDPQAFVPFTRQINQTFGNIDDVVNGKGIGSAVVGSETVDVNFEKLFTDPPADLKAFLPKDFEGGEREIVDSATGQKFRNYSRGNPAGWDVEQYRKYFPGIRSGADGNEDVKRTARVLSQSWGGGLLGFPLASVLY